MPFQMTLQEAMPALHHGAGHGQCDVMSLALNLQVAVRNAQQGVFYFTDQVGLGKGGCANPCRVPLSRSKRCCLQPPLKAATALPAQWCLKSGLLSALLWPFGAQHCEPLP